MNASERDEFLSEPLTAVLATVDPKGRAHAVPVWYLWNGESFEIIGGKDSAKMRHVELHGRAALCIDRRGDRVQHVTAEGPAELGGTATPEWRLKLHTHYRGREAADKIVAQGGNASQQFLTLTPDRWYAWPDALE